MKSSLRSTSSDFIELSNEEVVSLRQGKWEIDCPVMVLVRDTPHGKSIVRGSGIIKQTIERNLVFKLYANRTWNISPMLPFGSFSTGRLIPDSAFFDLQATDMSGRKWNAKRLLPSFDWGVAGKPIANGNLQSIACKGLFSRSTGSGAYLRVPDRIKIPLNAGTKKRESVARGKQRSSSMLLNAWKFSCDGLDYLLVRESDEFLTISMQSPTKQTPSHYVQRVIEALEFVLGRPLNWLTLEKHTGRNQEILISSQSVFAVAARLQPILPTNFADPKTRRLKTTHHRKMFEKYLKHVLDFTELHHPLAGQFLAIYEASAGRYIDALGLTLTVAIESILNKEFDRLGKASPEDTTAINDAIAYLEKWDRVERIKSRIVGSVRALLQVRVGDTMRELVRIGAITKSQSEAWQKLRNSSAHSYQTSKLRNPEFSQLLQQNEVLFYHLIFHAIGYKGPYMDFSEPGWPIREYPARQNAGV